MPLNVWYARNVISVLRLSFASLFVLLSFFRVMGTGYGKVMLRYIYTCTHQLYYDMCTLTCAWNVCVYCALKVLSQWIACNAYSNLGTEGMLAQMYKAQELVCKLYSSLIFFSVVFFFIPYDTWDSKRTEMCCPNICTPYTSLSCNCNIYLESRDTRLQQQYLGNCWSQTDRWESTSCFEIYMCALIACWRIRKASNIYLPLCEWWVGMVLFVFCRSAICIAIKPCRRTI